MTWNTDFIIVCQNLIGPYSWSQFLIFLAFIWLGFFYLETIGVKAKSNYRGSAENQATQKFYIQFFIDNYNVNFILYILSCVRLKSGLLKVYKLMFALELSMKKWIKKNWAAGFSVIPTIIAFVFKVRPCYDPSCAIL